MSTTQGNPLKAIAVWGVPLAILVVTLIRLFTSPDSESSPEDDVRVIPHDDPGTVGAPWPAGSLRSPAALYELAVYHLPRPTGDVDAVLSELLKGTPLTRVETLPEEMPETALVMVHSPPIEEYAPPAPDTLQHAGEGLTEEQVKALQGSEQVTALRFLVPGEQVAATYRSALTVLHGLATRTGGALWDEETRQAFSPEAWQERLVGWEGEVPAVPRQFTIHVYRDGELNRMVTLGMAKLALPDLVINQVSKSDIDMAASLINLTAQTFFERPRLEREGLLDVNIDDLKNASLRESLTGRREADAKKGATLHLAKAKKEEGDAENPLVELVFPGDGSLQARQQEVLAGVFGVADSISYIQHDEKLEAASQRAHKKALTLKPRFEGGPPQNENLLVKAPFEVPKDGSSEWMWVEVTAWKGDTVTGILQNTPFEIPDLKSGARVEVKEDVIFDYIWYRADGTEEGNETGAIIQQMQRAPEKKLPSPDQEEPHEVKKVPKMPKKALR